MQVGLRLLLCPLGSNIVVRTACCSVGVVLPVYSTFKAIESKDQDDQHKWLVYWAAYGSFTVAETFTDKLLYWCPFYYHLKFAFLVWLQLPSVEVGLSKINPVLFGFVKWALQLSLYGAVVIGGLVFGQYHILLVYICVSIAMGASVLYTNYLRAFLQKHQARLDQIVIFFRSEMVKFASKHEAEIQQSRIGEKVMLGGRRETALMKKEGGKSRIAAAIFVGILLGCVFAFFYPGGFFVLSSTPLSRRRVAASDPEVQFFTAHLFELELFYEISTSLTFEELFSRTMSNFILPLNDLSARENAELKRQVKELTEKLGFAEQGKDSAQKQVMVLGKQQKAGPFGTVKALRTNPAVVPDESVNPKLAKLLEKVAVNHEIIVTLANSNVKDMLEVWFTNIKRVGIPNYLVFALDEEIYNLTGGNHAVSGLKFRILREFLQMGYSVLLSDVDIVYLQNPFEHLYRDSDVESMTDGHNNMTAYGYNDVFDEPEMGWARPTIPSIELLDRVASRLARENAWDQAVFNEELFYPSHPGYEGLHASRRTMDHYLFMNSKVLFKTVRKDSQLRKLKPVVIHVNYHPDKLWRMNAVVDYYVNGKQDALDPFPDGSS
ncbi:hypothetical protein SASPL_158130 [Salvia splendens]|uniref:Nucleotide-diphospho-sugar transferase domain-containing protein n=1 Tax=Salvia splendens TaxID=180675 RepID=A0A8X8VTS5_SALSN|nr:hypothetical protein SASPL_158130 [Salvia splendens]